MFSINRSEIRQHEAGECDPQGCPLCGYEDRCMTMPVEGDLAEPERLTLASL